jgi:hypothetical protein
VLEPKTLAGFAGLISLTIAANLMLKLGAAVPVAERVLFGLLGWKSVVGLALFGCGGTSMPSYCVKCRLTSPKCSRPPNLSAWLWPPA